VLEELNSIFLLDRLHHQRLDAVFIRLGKEPSTNVNFLPLPSESMMVVVSSEHRLAGCYAVELRELKGEPMVLFSRALGSAFYDKIIETCQKAGFELMIGQVAPQISSIANLVAAGIGISIVPERIAAAAVTEVSYLPIKGIALVARMVLATRTADRSVITKNFRTLVQQATGQIQGEFRR